MGDAAAAGQVNVATVSRICSGHATRQSLEVYSRLGLADAQ